MVIDIVQCNYAKSGECKLTDCPHYNPHTPNESCNWQYNIGSFNSPDECLIKEIRNKCNCTCHESFSSLPIPCCRCGEGGGMGCYQMYAEDYLKWLNKSNEEKIKALEDEVEELKRKYDNHWHFDFNENPTSCPKISNSRRFYV